MQPPFVHKMVDPCFIPHHNLKEKLISILLVMYEMLQTDCHALFCMVRVSCWDTYHADIFQCWKMSWMIMWACTWPMPGSTAISLIVICLSILILSSANMTFLSLVMYVHVHPDPGVSSTSSCTSLNWQHHLLHSLFQHHIWPIDFHKAVMDFFSWYSMCPFIADNWD